METRAIVRGVRLSVDKGRLVADLIRGKKVGQALDILTFTQKKAALIIKKALESAIANAEHNDGADIDELMVKTIYVEQGATLKRVGKDHTVEETVAREGLWEAQTPQVFRRDLLLKAYANRGKEPATDDAQLVERLGHKVTVVPGSPVNLKITTKEDLHIAVHMLKALPKPKTLGPVHPFDERFN